MATFLVVSVRIVANAASWTILFTTLGELKSQLSTIEVVIREKSIYMLPIHEALTYICFANRKCLKVKEKATTLKCWWFLCLCCHVWPWWWRREHWNFRHWKKISNNLCPCLSWIIDLFVVNLFYMCNHLFPRILIIWGVIAFWCHALALLTGFYQRLDGW